MMAFREWIGVARTKLALLGVSLLSTIGCFITENPPTGLVYSPNTHSILVGRSSRTYPPTLDGGISEDVTFAIASGGVQGIEIDPSTGEISIDESAPIGEFPVDLLVMNAAGATTFTDAIALSVLSEAVPPVAAVYATAAISLTVGDSYSSDPPFVDDGGEPITSYLLISSIPGLSIAPTTGVINVASTIEEGVYVVGVKAENLAGISVLNDLVTITVNVPSPVSFVSDIRPIISGSCAPCHTGGSQVNLSVYTNAKNRIGEIVRRINLLQNESDFMPRGGSKLSTITIDLFEEWERVGSPEN